jgi:N-acetylglucosaminyldiphosphoundecaprenol N-acetyl-beta-D-mannosaminyltransferase
MKNLPAKTLFDIPLPTDDKKTILEKIKKNIDHPALFFHIVSLNPEIIELTKQQKKFKEIVKSAQMHIVDGTGIVLAANLLHIPVAPRLSGVDLLRELLDLAGHMRLRVVLIGGKSKVANVVAECYQQKYPEAQFIGLEGIHSIQNPQKKENEAIFSIVAATRPHFVFVSFGSPWQELWIEQHQTELKYAVCMGVGGSFDFISGNVARAPAVFRAIGLEWLFRLLRQPWRWKRQLRLLQFIRDILYLKIFKGIFS